MRDWSVRWNWLGYDEVWGHSMHWCAIVGWASTFAGLLGYFDIEDKVNDTVHGAIEWYLRLWPRFREAIDERETQKRRRIKNRARSKSERDISLGDRLFGLVTGTIFTGVALAVFPPLGIVMAVFLVINYVIIIGYLLILLLAGIAIVFLFSAYWAIAGLAFVYRFVSRKTRYYVGTALLIVGVATNIWCA